MSKKMTASLGEPFTAEPTTGHNPAQPLASLLAGFGAAREQLLPVLHAIQKNFGYVPPTFHAAIADHFNLTRAEVNGVVSYYHDFRDTPPGKIVIKICRAEACQAMGADAVAEYAQTITGCSFGQTRADGHYTLDSVYCLGLCASAPAAMVQGEPHARLTPKKLEQILKKVG